MVTSIAACTPAGAIRLALRVMLLALIGAGLALPAHAQSSTQRLLDAKRQQEQAAQSAPAQSGAAQPAGDATTIEAQGLASYYPDDAARSRSEAIEAAQRDAVEQASGVFITSESELRNFDLVSDEVLSRSKGFIRKYDVIKEGLDGPFYGVTIRAIVIKQAFIKDVDESLENLYRRVGKPRVMLVVDEIEATSGGEGFVSNSANSLNIVEKEIRKILLQQGVTFVDARALTKGSVVEKAQKGANTDRESLLDSARTSKAELVILGRGRISAKGMLQQFNIVEASVGLDVIRSDNGQVMASDVSTSRGLHINADTASVVALQKAAQDITPKIMGQVTYLWIREQSQGRRIEMVVKNASFGDVMALRRALSNDVRGVKSVRQLSFSDGVALLEVQSKDSADRLAESLYSAQFKEFKLSIQDVTATTLTVHMVKSR